MKPIFWGTGIILLLLCPACKNNIVYSSVKTMPVYGWKTTNPAEFTFAVPDTTANYNVLLYVRHRKNYPYQNLWLFIEKKLPDSTIVYDTVECYLSDQRGRWLGNGMGSILEIPVLYEQNIRFPRNGNYTYRIYQGMREDTLIGINDIGISIERNQ